GGPCRVRIPARRSHERAGRTDRLLAQRASHRPSLASCQAQQTRGRTSVRPMETRASGTTIYMREFDAEFDTNGPAGADLFDIHLSSRPPLALKKSGKRR